MMEHNLLHLAAIITAVLTFNMTILFTSGALGHRLGLFVNSTQTLSQKFYLDRYSLEVTPADWVFYMTALIYFWQSVWIFYGVTLVCRKTENGYFYRTFQVMPPILYVVFSFALACNISWLLIWDKEYMEVALVFVNLMTCTLFICLVVSLRRLKEFGVIMTRQKYQRDIWLMRVLLQNGLGMFAAWGTVASMFNFAIVLTYRTGAEKQVGSTVSLAMFTLECIAWWMFDNFVFEKLLRYLYTPYIVLLISIAGIISKNWTYPPTPNVIFTIILLILMIVMTTIKIALSVHRHKKNPLFEENDRPTFKRPVMNFEVRGLLQETRS